MSTVHREDSDRPDDFEKSAQIRPPRSASEPVSACAYDTALHFDDVPPRHAADTSTATQSYTGST